MSCASGTDSFVDDDSPGCSWTRKHLHQLHEWYAGEVELIWVGCTPAAAVRGTESRLLVEQRLLLALCVVAVILKPSKCIPFAGRGEVHGHRLRARPTWGVDWCWRCKAGPLGAQPSLRQPIQHDAEYVAICVAQLHWNLRDPCQIESARRSAAGTCVLRGTIQLFCTAWLGTCTQPVATWRDLPLNQRPGVEEHLRSHHATRRMHAQNAHIQRPVASAGRIDLRLLRS